MKVAMIGHGFVGSIHANRLLSETWVELVAVFGTERDQAVEFARTYGIKNVCSSLKEAASLAEAAIICSPSSVHHEQARESLGYGLPTLVEMPPCGTGKEAEELGQIAASQQVRLQCAHTSRYLSPYRRVSEIIQSGVLGTVQQVDFVRHHKLKERAWTDDALLHHAAHPLDLMFWWFGGIRPIGCAALPQARGAQTVSLLGRLPTGAPATISITFASKMPHVRMHVVGDRHTVETDGFSYVKSDLENLNFSVPDTESYEQGIHDQDVEFLRSCAGDEVGIHWQEAVKLMETINAFQALEMKA